MKDYKALVIDLDGTTVPHLAGAASNRVKEAVMRAHEHITVCIATGRLQKHTRPIIDQLNISGPCVINNGCQLYDPQKKEVLFEVLLEEEVIEPVFKIVSSYGDHCIVSDGEIELPAQEWQALSKVMNFFIGDITDENIIKLQDDLHAFPQITTNKMTGLHGKNPSVEVIGARGTKQYGIYEVAKLLKIPTTDIIGIGDGYNDFPLLMACGLKIAMGNAVPELKEIADLVCPTVEEDGVAVVIEKLILSE